MASQVAAEALNRKSSDGVILDITPAQISRRQQSQNALRKADFSVASQEFGFYHEKAQGAIQSQGGGSHDGRIHLLKRAAVPAVKSELSPGVTVVQFGPRRAMQQYA